VAKTETRYAMDTITACMVSERQTNSGLEKLWKLMGTGRRTTPWPQAPRRPPAWRPSHPLGYFWPICQKPCRTVQWLKLGTL